MLLHDVLNIVAPGLPRFVNLTMQIDGAICIVKLNMSVGLRSCWRQGPCAKISGMSSIAEIENAIEKLPAPQVDELAGRLETLRARRATPTPIESWLQGARGAARPGETTGKVMALTRGEE